MARSLGYAFAFGAVGILVSLGALRFAAGTWSSFSDWWTFSVIFLPALGVVGAAALARPSSAAGHWIMAFAAALLSGLSAYLGVLVVSATWHADVLSRQGLGFFDLVLNPSKAPAIYETRRGSSFSMPPLVHGLIGSGVAMFLYYKMRPSPGPTEPPAPPKT